MILSSHIIVATVATAPLITQPISISNTLLAFSFAFIIHFILDFIPHWDYELHSLKSGKTKEEVIFTPNKKNVLKDLIKTTVDGTLGLIVIFWLIPPPFYLPKIFLIGIVVLASILPDILETVYLFWKTRIIVFLHSLHQRNHTNHRIYNPILGLPMQTIIVVIIVLIF